MNFTRFLSGISNEPLRVLDATISLNGYVEIDLSIYNEVLKTLDISDPDVCENYINSYVKNKNAKVAYGGYLEERNLYKGNHNFIGDEERNIHLGIDLWCDEGTAVLAVLEGEVHSFQNNNRSGDYGPTIILKHTIGNVEFHSLYGHLSLKSIGEVKIGQKVDQGEAIATLGSSEVNVGYASHLHFQVIRDLNGKIGDYPGVCSRKNIDFYEENCPDPNILLKF